MVKTANKAKKTDERLSIPEFDQAMFDRIIPVRALGIDSKLITYWRKEGLLPFIEKGTWARFSFVESMWIMILNSLRNIGIPIERMKRLTEYFIDRAYDEDLPKKNHEYNIGLLKKKKVAGTITTQEQIKLEILEKNIQNEALMYALKWDVNYFSNLVLESIRFRKEAFILLFENGTVAERVYEADRTLPGKTLNYNMPHLIIPLNYYLEVFIRNEELSTFLNKAHILNEDEERVLREMRNKNVQEINIKRTGKQSLKITATKTGIIKEDKAEQVKMILGMGNYESVTLHTIDEKTLSFKKTKIKK